MPLHYAAIDLQKNELRQAVVQNTTPAPSSPVKGQIYYDTGVNILYWFNGSTWVPAQGGAGTSPATTVTTQAFADAPVVGIATTFAREDHKHGMPAHNAAAHATIPISSFSPAIAVVDMGSFKIQNLGNPTIATDAANKQYVDNLVQGLDAKASVRCASTGNLASLTGIASIDGVALASGDRVLLKDQSTAAQNGIYTWASSTLTRASDMDSWTEVPSAYVWVESGTVWADTGWLCYSDPGGVLDTTPMVWTQFSGAGQITAGAGMTKTGNTLDVVAGDTSLTVAADSMIVNTSVIATVASLASYAKKFAAALTGTASPETVTHNLNTRDIHLTVLNGSTPYTAVEVDWDATTLNTATIRYNPNLGAGYRVVVLG